MINATKKDSKDPNGKLNPRQWVIQTGYLGLGEEAGFIMAQQQKLECLSDQLHSDMVSHLCNDCGRCELKEQ